MLKIIHGADLHLGRPFSGLSPELAAKRYAEQLRPLDDMARLAEATKSDLVLLSGNVLDPETISGTMPEDVAAALGKIPCQVFIAPGDQDLFAPGCLYDTVSWPDNVHIFTDSELTSVDLPRLNCTVWGCACTDPHSTASPLTGFTAPEDGRIHVMVLHGTAAPEEIAASGLAYLALGHGSEYSGLQKSGETCWACPGCTEGRSFEECGEKGILYVELFNGQCKARFAPICPHRYRVLNIDLTGEERLLDTILEALPSDTKEDICRLVLTGVGHVSDLSALERVLEGRFYGLSLLDRTCLPQSIWDRREENSLTGLFLRQLCDRREEGMNDHLCQLAARLGLAAMGNEEVSNR